ncbi:DNA-binding Lrp family transcriptional regulator [Saccharopolyspora lacisalsi]|uniref:DNA-binding Lrp family transcriptional regulator n=1 Tax=Halosaccharopolyspora lacisalsi TaxID=1000566 RepID=A0A839E6B1_9PSEU|nr:Lrp/AsnC family transcriptional regulator [Halosaccharopolyspora lacisalsi]MBA8826428.1 DNA-binding Lrp family transcriptional regulator [Halosaccharopolyspora lacisalsi]
MNSILDEQDLTLLHALQIAPRVSWAEAARVLGTTAATLASRWERMRSSGMAWVTVHPVRQLENVAVALVDVDVDPARKPAVVEALCRDPRAATVEESASGRDLMVTAIVADSDSMSRFVLDDLPGTAGVRRVETYSVTELHWEGSRWRLDALDRDQQAALHAASRPHGGSKLSTIPADYWSLVEALTYDGRRSAADMARLTGRTPSTVRRQVTRLLASNLLSFRCEVAQLRTRWPLACTWFARVPAPELERTVQSLSTLPELRLCASTVGRSNLVFMVWAQSPGELMRLERRLNEKLPWLELTESALLLRVPKRMGWVLDADGRSTGDVVPSPAHARRSLR